MGKESEPEPPPFDRSVEMRWLGLHFKELERTYPGEWLAIEGESLVAHGPGLVDVLSDAQRKGVENPFIAGTRPTHLQDVDTVA